MSLSDIRKQKREHRFNINLNDDEAEMFNLISKMTGEKKGVILRNMAVMQALTILTTEEQYTLQSLLEKGAQKHLQRS
ncbi:hypothetical protein QSV37_17635 [Acinetobacter sp. VNK23]|uniref:hypothetical protein n=1 Tax=Acinetobacter thutiue TaxID=2998078 RepID=UPI0025777B11|nr:hypothetical protein [Acinetobacter thutiue]MDM1022097.1 hypothetical protein [Acinetobacter thutiue]